MAARSLPNFLIKWVYPAALTALNTFFLTKQIRNVKDDLGMLKSELENFKIDNKNMKDDMKRLTARQTELERRALSHMAAAEELLKGCDTEEEIDERSLLFPVLCYALNA